MSAPVSGLLLVGCGKMGGALLAGWLRRKIAGPIRVIEPDLDATRAFRDRPDIGIDASAEALPGDFRPAVVVFAVKPQGMDKVVPAFRHLVGPGTVFLSIAAGRKIAFFASHLGPEAAIVRAMPNTPAAVGRGISVLCANRHVSPAGQAACEALLAAVGEVAWIEDEALMDAVTAVSGSGPAYVFLLAECLAEAGAAAGLDPALALRLARATVAGAGELLHLAPDAPATLRRNVAAPGGTTHAALEVLMGRDGLGPLLTRAVAAAAKRSRELAT